MELILIIVLTHLTFLSFPTISANRLPRLTPPPLARSHGFHHASGTTRLSDVPSANTLVRWVNENASSLSYEVQRGMYLHPTYAVTPDREPLGVVDAWMWAREPPAGCERGTGRHQGECAVDREL
ncbi:hypothetical protein AWB78_08015 [Caballeronia calidae]|uniref:Uncharacterized protein n=1 Tax=Caballeronia calidae TaxID=1777139 RepID=A0A158EHP2_9BURK|nr:hypothetical protein AWB78_08015 [Caballeronia calidae]